MFYCKATWPVEEENFKVQTCKSKEYNLIGALFWETAKYNLLKFCSDLCTWKTI